MYKYSYFFTFLMILGIPFSGKSQESDDAMYRTDQTYFSQETEMIFSFANIDAASMSIDNIMRWSPVFNFTGHLNHDFSKYFGLDAGFGIRNVGFIAKFPNEENSPKRKFRTYNLGIPLGIKVGNLNQRNPFFFFTGYEVEMPFHYKEKLFINGDKTNKITGWFSNRTDRFTQSLYAGVQFPQGFSLKFKYYLNNFFNQDYEEFADGVSTHPYAGVNVNVFYFSINWFPFQDVKLYEIRIPDSDGTVTSSNWH